MRPLGLDQLNEGLHRVAKAGGSSADGLDALGCHIEPVGLSLVSFPAQLDPGSQPAGAGVSLDRQLQAADPSQRVAKSACGGEIRIRSAGHQYQRQTVAECKGSGGGANAGGSRQQRRHGGESSLHLSPRTTCERLRSRFPEKAKRPG